MIAAVADTHTVIWYLYGDKRLSAAARDFMEQAAQDGNQIGLSAITLVEMVYLIEKGRIAAESFTRLAQALDNPTSVLTELPLNLPVTRALQGVDAAQIPDMPDRIIAATAVYLSVPVISRDALIVHSSIQTIW